MTHEYLTLWNIYIYIIYTIYIIYYNIMYTVFGHYTNTTGKTCLSMQ